MRRWIIIVSILICAGTLYLLVSGVVAQHAERMREQVFQRTLHSYQQALNPGAKREKVERYLKSNGVPFERGECCVTENQEADLVKIGERAKLWYCNKNTEYIAFQFTAPSTAPPDPNDVLDKVTLYQQLGGCL